MLKITKVKDGYNIQVTVPFWVKCLVVFYLLILLSNILDKLFL